MQNFEETWSSAVRRHSVSAAVFLSGLCRLHQSIADSFSPRQAHPRRRRGIGQSTVARPPAHRGPATPRKVTAWPRSPAAAPAPLRTGPGMHARGRAIWHDDGRGSYKIYRRLIDRSPLSQAPGMHPCTHTREGGVLPPRRE